MALKFVEDELCDYANKKTQVIVNGIEAERVKDKKTGEYKGGTTIDGVYHDFIGLKVHNVKSESKTDKLVETIEIIKIPFAAIVSVSEGPKSTTQGTLEE